MSPLPSIPRGAVKAYRELLNRQNAESIAREAGKDAMDPSRMATRHKHGRYQQVKRLYGDYLYAQDREKFLVDLQDWLATPEAAALLLRPWVKVGAQRYQRPDNAVVRYDHSVECSTSRPWLDGHRGWMAFGPGEVDGNYLACSFRRSRRGRVSRMSTPRKFKTAEAAMAAVDREFPFRPLTTQP